MNGQNGDNDQTGVRTEGGPSGAAAGAAGEVRKPVVVVSGLPRSGTSLMMSMLAAAGLPVVTDERRAPDEDNPRGYFEIDRVKQLPTDAQWLWQEGGRAIKIIYRLLPWVPATLPCRIVFMERDLDEVIRSQQAMLRRQGAPELSEAGRQQLVRSYERELAQVRARLAATPAWKTLFVPHAALVAEPSDGPEAATMSLAPPVAALVPAERLLWCRAVAEHVGAPSSAVARMEAVVDGRLYRNRRRAAVVAAGSAARPSAEVERAL